MANFPRVNTLGWAVNDPLTSAQMNALDINMSKAVNGDEGGTWTPSSIIEIGGSGLRLAAALNLELTSREVKRRQTFIAIGEALTSGNWSFNDLAGKGAIYTNNTLQLGELMFRLDRLLHGSTLNEVWLRWTGGGGHAAFPGGAPTMPKFVLYATNVNGTRTALGTGTDTSASEAIYNAAHWIKLTGLSHTVDLSDAGNHYYVVVDSESGSNYQVNAYTSALVAVADVDAYSEF